MQLNCHLNSFKLVLVFSLKFNSIQCKSHHSFFIRKMITKATITCEKISITEQ